MDNTEYNRHAWDKQVEQGNEWTCSVDRATIKNARNGEWTILLTPHKPVPADWFPGDLAGKKVLGLASGGGQQGPILAATGADVTVIDNSPRQLEQDVHVAQRDGLDIATELGDMRDLGRFADSSFDLVVNPASNCFVESVLPVWREVARVLRPGGALLTGFANSNQFIFDLRAWNEGRLEVRHSIPYADTTDLSASERQELILDQDEPLCFGHSLHDQIQGQIDAGLVIVGFYEDTGGEGPLDRYIDSFIATRAVKAVL